MSLGALGRAGARRIWCADPPASTEAPHPRPGASRSGPGALTRLGTRALTPSPAWSTWQAARGFDLGARRHIGAGEHLIAFNGQALAQLRAARAAGFESASLVSATSHMRTSPSAIAWHTAATRSSVRGGEGARAQPRRVRAGRSIFVASEHIRDSFLAEGVPEERLRLSR